MEEGEVGFVEARDDEAGRITERSATKGRILRERLWNNNYALTLKK